MVSHSEDRLNPFEVYQEWTGEEVPHQQEQVGDVEIPIPDAPSPDPYSCIQCK